MVVAMVMGGKRRTDKNPTVGAAVAQDLRDGDGGCEGECSVSGNSFDVFDSFDGFDEDGMDLAR